MVVLEILRIIVLPLLQLLNRGSKVNFAFEEFVALDVFLLFVDAHLVLRINMHILIQHLWQVLVRLLGLVWVVE